MLLTRVKRTIDRYHLLDDGDRLIVGVSGGVDSMVLLRLLNAWRAAYRLTLIVAHVNHGLRPQESENEADLVREESARLDLAFEYGRFNVKALAKERGLSVQDAGRKVRFEFFRSLREKHGARKIALGHHADDQVETVLLRLLRGSGLRGLRGMVPLRDGLVIRPLLEAWKEEIESFARENAIPYLTDSSNLGADYLRNRLRLRLIPMIEKEFQPGFRERILRTAAILGEEDRYLEKKAEESCRKIVLESEKDLTFRFREYDALDEALKWRFIRKVLERFALEPAGTDTGTSGIDRICQKLKSPSASFCLNLPQGISVKKSYETVEVKRGREDPLLPFDVALQIRGRTFIEAIDKEILIEEIPRDEAGDLKSRDPNIAFLDPASLRFPLRMRNFRPGDRFRPLGAGGTQKVKEFFINHKIPKSERSKIPLLVSNGEIVWIAGYRIDDRAKITDRTEKILKVELR